MRAARRKAFILISLCAAALTLTGLLALGLWIWSIDREWSPILEPRLRAREELSSVRVMARDRQARDQWVASLTAGRTEERMPLKLSEIPPLMAQAVVVLEDPRFLTHGGFDVWGIARAFLRNVRAFRFAQGGSTITQQLVKNVFLSNERTLSRKVKELVLSTLIERRFLKDEILQAYLNEVYLGQLGNAEVHGVGRGAEYYFGKKLNDLDLHEFALLAAVIAGPGYYSPWSAPDRTRARRDRVLKALADAKLILPEELQAALSKDLPKRSAALVSSTRMPYLLDALREQLLAQKGEAALLRGGFEVHLALDLELQQLAEKSLREASAKWAPEQQALLVGADPRDCSIKFYAGGTQYALTQFDRIRQSRRPIGSLMKPLEVAALLENDRTLNLATLLEDKSFEWVYDSGRGKWSPDNYDKKFRGPVSLRQTLEESINVPIARIFHEREPSGLLFNILEPVRHLGLDVPADKALPSALLGAIDQQPWRVLQAYVHLTRQALGLASDALDSACALSFESNPAAAESKGNYGQNGARLTIAALQGALRRGTSRALGAQLPPQQEWAGKTGTSSDLRDSWYALMAPDLVLLGWVGRDDNKETGLTGATGAMPLVATLAKSWANYSPDPAIPAPRELRWPRENLSWLLLEKQRLCQPPSGSGVMIRSANPEPTSATPPPEAFEQGGQAYIYELFRSEATPANCP